MIQYKKVPTHLWMITMLLIGFMSCNTIPEGVTAVKSFDKNKYLGKWYEIARFDFRFEKDLNNTTAEYSVNEDGSIKVLNQGYNTQTGKWVKAEGKAKFVGEEDVAMLKVSFFGPFYAGYNVIALDTNYKYALVAGQNLDYLWILSRYPTVSDSVKLHYIQFAKAKGFNTDKLLWVEHTQTK
jgi:apolipoprotein D and lipocalin family protein